jgi:preprotein translocase subunit SecD
MTTNRPDFKVIQGRSPDDALAERIALSLVHARARIDIPVSAIVRIEALEEFNYFVPETGQHLKVPQPHVEVCFKQEIHDRICQLTRHIIDEPLDIIVGGERICSPIVREPLCSQEAFVIHIYDLSEAHALAHRMRAGWIKSGPRAVS